MNIVLFGPNGSGKGTQGSVIQKKFGIPHIETGVIFRHNISLETDLGKKAKSFIDKGQLVPDEITIPMIMDRLRENDCKKGWLLDGFPRNLSQAEALYKALANEGISLDFVVEIVLDREDAKKRIMGRRLCTTDNNHPNNVNIPAIEPAERDGVSVCRVCGGTLTTRADDQDEAAIDTRHNIYYDTDSGTMAGINYLKQEGSTIIGIDGRGSVSEVTGMLLDKLPDC